MKNINQKIKNRLAVVARVVATLLYIFSATLALAAVGDGVILYDETTPTTSIQGRTWTESSAAVGGEVSPFAGSGTSKHMFVKGSHTREEMILGIEDSAGLLTIYKSVDNGANWVSQWTATVGDGNLRRFDIAYEQTSGDALVVYSANVGTTNELKYQTWNGTSWSGALNLDLVRTSGTVYGIRIVERPSSNEIGVVWVDTNFDLSANVWTGSAWYGEPAAALSVNISKIGTNTTPTNRAYDLAFEGLSGDLMVIWGEDAVLDPKYVIKAAGGAWGSVIAPTTFNEEGTMIDVSPSPVSDRIAYVNCTDNGGDCDFAVWLGSGWGTTVNDATSRTPVVGDGGNNVDWLVDGANEVAIMTYGDSAAGGIDWYTSTNGGNPSAQTDNTTAPAVAGFERAALAKVSPADPKQGLFFFVDANLDIFVKKASLSGTTVTWSSPTGASAALETATTFAGMNPVAFAYAKYSAVTTLTIGATVGSKVGSLNSGDTNQYAQTTSCVSAAACAAFTILPSSAETLNSIKLTQTGTINSAVDLANVAIFYDTDGNYANGVTGQYGSTVASFTGNTVTVSGSLAMNAATTYYFYVRTDLINGANNPRGGQTLNYQIAANSDVTTSGTSVKSGAPVSLAGTTNITPNATGITYGASLADGARSGESVTVSGFGFGVAPGGLRANCAGAVDTGCIRFTVGGNATVLDADITAWSNTSVTFTVNSAIATYGGVSALEVVAGSQSDTTDLTYYIYPNVTGMTTCSSGGARDSACGTNAAEEYAAGDTFGLIQLSGDHFNTTAGSISFTGGFGALPGTVHNVIEGPCTVAGWGGAGTGNTLCLEVNPLISDSVYDGFVTLTRTGDSKTDAIDLHILPRITSNAPINGVIGDTIAINGDHFCQTGICPAAPPSTDYIAYFGATQPIASEFVMTCSGGVKWSDTQVCVKVPTGVPAGSQETKIKGKAAPLYESERAPFTINTTIPDDPTRLRQYRSDATQLIPEGSSTVESTIVFKADTTASIAIDMALQVEVKSTAVSFDGTGVVEGTVGGGGACTACTTHTNARISISGISDGTKQWRARVRNTTTNEFSNWVSFGVNPDGSIDVKVDTVAPDITNVSSGTPSPNGATITWDTSGENSTSQVQYNKTGIFVDDCAVNNDCTTLDAALVLNHSVALSNLDSGTLYYFRVRSQDAAGNETLSANNTFMTGSVTQPAKTTTFYLLGRTGVLAGGETSSTTFSVLAPEMSPLVKSAFVVVTGISSGGGTNNVSVQVNTQAAQTYAIDASSQTPFTLVYNISPASLYLNDIPATNALRIIPSIDTAIASAKVVVTYAYTP